MDYAVAAIIESGSLCARIRRNRIVSLFIALLNGKTADTAGPIRKVLARNIKKYRKNFGYSQAKLAEKAGLSSQTMNDIEGCRRWVSAKTITRLAKALNIAEYQLLVPESRETSENTRRSSLESLISLQITLLILLI